MDITLLTVQVDASVALRAHSLYKSGSYSEAMRVLMDILDIEPNNHQARLYLGACYFKTGQSMAASRALRAVYEKASDPLIRQKACLALQIVSAEITSKLNSIPAEFGELSRGRTEFPTIESVVQ